MPRTLREHYDFLSDHVRLEQFEAAIGRTIEPGHTVLDLGCGSGVLGLMALRAGAGKVYFVEEGPVIEVARQAIKESGYGAMAEFFKVNSYELELPEKVDTVVCDHVGCFGFDYGILALLSDANSRFLNPDGTIVPTVLEIILAPIESDGCRDRVGKWRDGSVPSEFALLRSAAANTKYLAEFEERELLSNPFTLATFRLDEESPSFLSWTAEFTSARAGTLDGLGGWFNCRLAGDIWLSNGPDVARRSHRPQVFLPLDEPVHINTGETIQVTVMARHLDDVIGWTVELPDSGRRFSQTTFNGLLLDHAALTSARHDRVARLNPRGRARQIVLSYCDGQRTVAEVEALVEREHPDLFPSARATSLFIASVLSGDTDE